MSSPLTPDDWREIEASRPEPAPKAEGEPVTPALLEWLCKERGFAADGFADAYDLVEARDAYGRAKYGQGLMTGDGRDTIEDARQELGDLLQYCWKSRMQGLSLDPIRRLLPVLVAMLEHPSIRNYSGWVCPHHGRQKGSDEDPELCPECMSRLVPPEGA